MLTVKADLCQFSYLQIGVESFLPQTGTNSFYKCPIGSHFQWHNYLSQLAMIKTNMRVRASYLALHHVSASTLLISSAHLKYLAFKRKPIIWKKVHKHPDYFRHWRVKIKRCFFSLRFMVLFQHHINTFTF